MRTEFAHNLTRLSVRRRDGKRVSDLPRDQRCSGVSSTSAEFALEITIVWVINVLAEDARWCKR